MILPVQIGEEARPAKWPVPVCSVSVKLEDLTSISLVPLKGLMVYKLICVSPAPFCFLDLMAKISFCPQHNRWLCNQFSKFPSLLLKFSSKELLNLEFGISSWHGYSSQRENKQITRDSLHSVSYF